MAKPTSSRGTPFQPQCVPDRRRGSYRSCSSSGNTMTYASGIQRLISRWCPNNYTPSILSCVSRSYHLFVLSWTTRTKSQARSTKTARKLNRVIAALIPCIWDVSPRISTQSTFKCVLTASVKTSIGVNAVLPTTFCSCALTFARNRNFQHLNLLPF